MAILINAINPSIGGLLVKGPKGSGKSTAVRALADVLPGIKVAEDCPFNCNPGDPSNICSVHSEKKEKGDKIPIEERKMAVVTLPLGATEDRVIGSLDVEKAIKFGVEALEPGILAEVNQNILYVDEVNLLPDHIADDLLDVAATGWNTVEREGISVSHPSRFIFVGTMNPEEGELRPQLLDRFPLSVTVRTISSVGDRVEIVKRNLEFEADPAGFYGKYEPLQDELRKRIIQARESLSQVTISDALLSSISKACVDLKVDGLRPDIVIAKAAKTLAAFEDRREVTLDDVLVAADLALSHRTREGGFLEPATSQEIGEVFTAAAKKVYRVEKTGETTKKEVDKKPTLKGRAMFWVKRDATEKEQERIEKRKDLFKKLQDARLRMKFLWARLGSVVWGIGKRLSGNPKDAPVTETVQIGGDKLRGDTYKDKEVGEKKKLQGIPTVSDAARSTEPSRGYPVIQTLARKITSPSAFFLRMGKIKTRSQSVLAGRHAHAITALHRGRPYSWKIPHGKPSDVHMSATIRAAAGRQYKREKPLDLALRISLQDVREKLRSYKAPLTLIFMVDLSGSMLYNLEGMKESLLKLHNDAFRYRDRVGIVALKDLSAVVVQHPIANLRVVASKLIGLGVSGFTPLAAGMYKAWEVLKEARRRDRSTVPVMVIITDGSANVPLKRSLEKGEVRQIDETLVAVREYEGVAVNDVFSVSKMIKREGIHVIAINTNPHMYGRETYGFLVTEQIARLTGGMHHSIGRLRTEKEFVTSMVEGIKQDQRTIVSER